MLRAFCPELRCFQENAAARTSQQRTTIPRTLRNLQPVHSKYILFVRGALSGTVSLSLCDDVLKDKTFRLRKMQKRERKSDKVVETSITFSNHKHTSAQYAVSIKNIPWSSGTVSTWGENKFCHKPVCSSPRSNKVIPWESNIMRNQLERRFRLHSGKVQEGINRFDWKQKTQGPCCDLNNSALLSKICCVCEKHLSTTKYNSYHPKLFWPNPPRTPLHQQCGKMTEFVVNHHRFQQWICLVLCVRNL